MTPKVRTYTSLEAPRAARFPTALARAAPGTVAGWTGGLARFRRPRPVRTGTAHRNGLELLGETRRPQNDHVADRRRGPPASPIRTRRHHRMGRPRPRRPPP